MCHRGCKCVTEGVNVLGRVLMHRGGWYSVTEDDNASLKVLMYHLGC